MRHLNCLERNQALSGSKRSLRNAALSVLAAGGLLAFAAPFAAADSITVTYSATNVSGSQWEYSYNLSGSVSSGDLLAIYFPQVTSASITNASTSSSNFTTSVLQPDASIPADGEYDILVNTTTTTFPSTLTVLFNYSGTGTPGAQSFTLYDSSFATIESATTTTGAAAATPEPSSLALLCLGTFGLWFACLKSKQRKVNARAIAMLAGVVLSLSLQQTAMPRLDPRAAALLRAAGRLRVVAPLPQQPCQG